MITAYNAMEELVDLLNTEILKGLPGTKVQWQMASSDRFVRNFPKVPGEDAREAAVMVLLYPLNGSVHTVFMQRPDYNGVHSGQISFPGGKRESTDDSLILTALREAGEETGVDSSKICVINTLTPLFIPVSNMVVTPVLGWIAEKPVFNHQPEEVIFLFDAEIEKFLDPSVIKTKPFVIRGETINVRYFDYDGYVIWGATAMILNELLAIIRNSELKLFLN